MKIDAFLSSRKLKKRSPIARWTVWLLVWMLLTYAPAQGRVQAADNGPASDPPPTITGAAYAPGEVLVGVRRDALPSSRDSDGIEAFGTLPGFAGLSLAGVEVLEITDAANAPLFLRLRVAEGAEMATIARLQADPAIAFAEPNWMAHAAVMNTDEMPTPVLPSDPLFRANQWGMQRIGAPRAWAISQGSTIRVAVVDSGIDFNHPEFAGRLLPGKNYVTPGATPQDDSGHGTHVSGIIGAALNNGEGVAGLAPQVLIDPRKALDSRNEGSVANIALAIREAADAGAKIINLSVTSKEPSSVLESAVNYAVGKGILLVGAVGNSAPNPVWWPAAYAGVVAVAATDRSDQRTYYSHTGAVDLAAPGGLSSQLIHSTWPTGINCPTVGSNYCTASGTSMSAAYVSGAAALAWSTRPDLSLVQIKNLLLETARKTGAPSTDVGAGRLDVQAAVRQALLSDVRTSRAQIAGLVTTGSPAYTETLTLDNPSGDLIFWQAAVVSGNEWLAVQPGAQNANGSIRYGEPVQVSLQVSPTFLPANDYSGALRIIGTRTNNSQVNLTIPVDLRVRSTLHRVYLSQTGWTTTPLQWQMADAQGKEPVQMTDSSSIGLPLPFTFNLESQAVTTVRLYSDGFMTFPASESVDALPVACTPDATPAQQAIYGWWADLNPSLGGSVSIFTSTSGAFVAEFLDVPLASAATAADRVSFQIALFPDGRVKLNYAALPKTVGDVAVGMEMNEGLLSSRIACRKGNTSLGALPVAGQTITLETTDLR
ncbi:MAG: S8 family serine peptidase [Chloroflexi bacterium]|nr:S8 family serine peptidase [Chloroflexota bacterium]